MDLLQPKTLDRSPIPTHSRMSDEIRASLLKNIDIEWPTVAVAVLCYTCWAIATTLLVGMSLALGIGLLALSITLHSSLQHEVIHGHPFRNQLLCDALVFPAIGVLIPFQRFRDTHLAHHKDAHLTDPYDDPESQYLDPEVWHRLSRPIRLLLSVNGTLLGRMLLGPLISQYTFMKTDWRMIRDGDRAVMRAWVLHGIGILPVILWLSAVGSMPFWGYALAVYLGMAVLRIRIFLEHQAHEHAGGRTVIIEDRGILAFLFLNNNFHAVHHIKPDTPWYGLPALYFENRENFLERNLGYSYPSYKNMMAQYLFRMKEPVAHPHYK